MKHSSAWDEFQWEHELRKHENRIARYFQALVYCIDLPAEEACADFQFAPAASGDPVSARRSNDQALQEWLNEHESEDEESEVIPERRPCCFAPVDAVDQLCVNWNIIAASKLNIHLNSAGMGVSCAFAQLLARVADFTEPGKDCTPALLVMLGKRSLTDMKELCRRLELIASAQPDLKTDTDALRNRLMLVREQLISRLQELRTSC